MLEHSGRYGRAALESLKSDAEYMKDPKRARDLLMMLDGKQQRQEQVSEKILAENVLIAPVFWQTRCAILVGSDEKSL